MRRIIPVLVLIFLVSVALWAQDYAFGDITVTAINKMAITAPASSSTLAVANGKTFTVNNTITLTGTDSTSYSLDNFLKLATSVTQTVQPTGAVNVAIFKANNATGREVLQAQDSSGNVIIDCRNYGAGTAGTCLVASLTTTSNCTSTASPSVCGSASSGVATIPSGATTLTVNTTQVNAASRIFYAYDVISSGCTTAAANIATLLIPYTSAKTAGTSFQMTVGTAPTTNSQCVDWWIVD